MKCQRVYVNKCYGIIVYVSEETENIDAVYHIKFEDNNEIQCFKRHEFDLVDNNGYILTDITMQKTKFVCGNY